MNISELLEELSALTEASKKGLRRRLQSFSGGTEGHAAQLRWKKKQQLQRRMKYHVADRPLRKHREKQAKRIVRAQKLAALKRRVS